MKEKERVVFFDGSFVAASQATVNAFSPAIITGPSPYETLRAYRSEDGRLLAFRAEDHFARLSDTLRLTRFHDPVVPAEMVDVLRELVARNDVAGDAHFRVHALGMEARRSAMVTDRTAIAIRVEERKAPQDRTVAARLSPWRRPVDASQFARAKLHGNPSFLRLSQMEAKGLGFEQVIFLNDRGTLSEGSYGNIFLVRSGCVSTPATHCSILPGITRDTVIALCAELGIPCREREIDPSELFLADEVFVTATSLEILPVARIDGHVVGTGDAGEVTARIRSVYRAAVRGADAHRSRWCTEIG